MDKGCPECGFLLWNPVAQLGVSIVGVYSDARFPGRCIVSLNAHHEHLEDVDSEMVLGFLLDVQCSMRAIKAATGSEQVDVAILGNTVAHVHAHLIPRYPEKEAFPALTPWDDPRPRAKMEQDDLDAIKVAILEALDVRA